MTEKNINKQNKKQTNKETKLNISIYIRIFSLSGNQGFEIPYYTKTFFI